ncbi:unnamed protein product [Zymoseptoria tritici ST99CH_1A5]|uniref:Uncharacterized protein n=2 Tax=Zymoseptoria tritici TaxID=1047171 RepID=A0A1X7RBZ7_ZYMT9|nr:unnamed protein product [Zymoseptoria tritici ST99CH_3D7]SMR43448.1 unnamed protein product [Zymoseptoria tritici ST99CH_3D1]SMY18593.1 unnamed protein product [Zymoseptoria tritici ST99CH_1A5]
MANPAPAELTDRSPIYVQRSPEALRSSQEIRGLARPLCDQPTDEIYLTPQLPLPANDITERRSHVHPHDSAFLTSPQAAQQLIDVIKKPLFVPERRWEYDAVAKDFSEWWTLPTSID